MLNGKSAALCTHVLEVHNVHTVRVEDEQLQVALARREAQLADPAAARGRVARRPRLEIPDVQGAVHISLHYLVALECDAGNHRHSWLQQKPLCTSSPCILHTQHFNKGKSKILQFYNVFWKPFHKLKVWSWNRKWLAPTFANLYTGRLNKLS